MLEDLTLSSDIVTGVLVATLGIILILMIRISSYRRRNNRSLILFRQQENLLRSLQQRLQQIDAAGTTPGAPDNSGVLLFSEITSILGNVQQHETSLNAAFSRMLEILSIDFGILELSGTQSAALRICHGIDDAAFEEALELVAARGWVLEEKRPAVEPVSFEAYQKLRQMRDLEKACSLLCVPCRVKSFFQVGRVTIGFHQPHIYTEAELEGLRFCADQFAIYNQMHQKLQDTQELSQLRHDYIANVSHELRTPLTTIYGYLNILKSYPPHLFQEDEKQQMFSVMTDECQRLIRLINNLLLSVKVEREDFPGTTSLAPVSLGDVVVAQTCRFMERELKSKSVEVHVDVPANLPSIEGNLDLLYQVFQNLIANAIKFSAKDPRIEIVAREEGDAVLISISDNGVGIEEQALTKIFQKFYRAESQAGKRPGLGIGLYLVQKLVELHHGQIKVASKLNEGTTFTLRFPKLKVEQTVSQTASG
jgi:signal transduction histidine kinase